MTAVSPPTCPACGAAVAPGAVTCSGCAAQIACASCRAPLPPQSAYCPRCGMAVAPPAAGASFIRRPRAKAPRGPVNVVAPGGGFAAEQSAAVTARCEAVIAAATSQLGIPAPVEPIDIELVENILAPGAEPAPQSVIEPQYNRIRAIYRPDAPGVELEQALLRLLLLRARLLQRDPIAAPFLLDGLLGILAQEGGFLPATAALNALLGQAQNAGMAVSATALLNGPPSAILYQQIATSFVLWLIAQKDRTALLTLLDSYDPARPDEAARRIYGKPFAALEKRWRASLRRAAPRPAGVGRFLRASLKYLKPYRYKQAEIIFYIICTIAFGQALPQAQRYLIDNALLKPNTGLLFTMLGLGLALFVILTGASLRQNYISAQVGEGVLRDLRLQMFGRLQDLSASFFARTSTGDILSRMSNDLLAVEFALTGALLQGLVLLLTFFASLGSLLYLDWKMTLLTLVVLPLFFLIARWLGPPASRASLARQQRLGEITEAQQENLAAQSVVRAYNLKRGFVREYTAQAGELYRSSIRLTFLGSLFGLSASLLTTLIQVLMFGIGGYFVIKHQLSFGALVAFLSLLGGLIAPAQSLSGVMQALQQASGAMERVTELLNEEPAIADAPDARTMEPLRQEIALHNVVFAYNANTPPQIAGISLRVQAGTAVALVGPSGSGKSTTASLLLRFYDPDSGNVTFDGIDAREISLASLRAQIGVVFQDNFLFNRSIRENIRFGREDATDAEVEQAARSAEVHDFIISMPQGYDTVAGERGASLSGGQRQRIAIARAILRNPSVLILDEATSALDARTENAINHTLAALARGRTTITITHRLAAAATADRVYVLDRGALVEEGTHGELLTSGGLYARLVEEQSGDGAGLALAAAVLRRVPEFATLDGPQLAEIAARLQSLRVSAGAEVVRQGEAGDALYLIVAGEAEVLAATGGPPLAVLRTGDYFGEVALLYDVPRTATVRARKDLTLYALDRDGFTRLLAVAPGIREAIEAAVVRRMGQHQVVEEAPADRGGGLFVTPWLRRGARLTLIEGGGAGMAERFGLAPGFSGIGRHPSNAVVLPDRRVSGFHARIERGPASGWTLTDSGSSNGTFLNGAPIAAPALLRNGDLIRCGGTTLRFETGAAE
jgi:ATP-binding cassette, subfamily B, bacterial